MKAQAELAEPVESALGLRISELHAAIHAALSGAGLQQLWVLGTITGLRRRGRVTSFELVEYGSDARTVLAVLPVTLFSRDASVVTRTLRTVGMDLADGLEAAFHGDLETNGAYGPLRFVARRVDPRVAIGNAVLAREELVAELEATGQLHAQRALPVPALPLEIGLVASSGAGVSDVLAVLEASPYRLHVSRADAAMSGPAAPSQVAGAIAELSRAQALDVIIVARGGGAKSDLAAWDSPGVARAIAGCPVPIWTALGHATDHTVADLVAQRSFPTPSAAAAELVALGEAAAADERRRSQAAAQEAALAQARARARKAVVVAAIVLALAVLLLLVGH
jgi:exodeoxyribonuclease VII large subunit